MPASYAHYRLGRDALNSLSPDARQCIQRFRRMFDMGLNGPDIFFYYFNPLNHSAAREAGKRYHNQTGAEFFTAACSRVDSEAARAYLYGLLGHYCLDSVCHPFIRRMVDISEAGHIALESEFERHLLARDGLEPGYMQQFSKRIRLTRGECMTVAAFYPPVTGAQVSASVRNMSAAQNYLASSNRARTQKQIRKFAPRYEDFLIPLQEREDYAFMVGELQDLYDQALARFPQLLGQLQAFMKTGEPLGEGFSQTF